ncbi:MAG: hypothetical protein COB16_08890 [Rhodobacteraceae bacterium]|nr:MAG: hypothetical protein COB16_08890 [Paracoccaceae bacterium]
MQTALHPVVVKTDRLHVEPPATWQVSAPQMGLTGLDRATFQGPTDQADVGFAKARTAICNLVQITQS